ncbi:MAG: carbohydrate porin [Opitutales bacterium]
MSSLKSKWIALLCSAALIPVGALRAQDTNALLKVLINKGIISADEAKQIQTEAKAAAAQNTTTVSGKIFLDVTTIDSTTAAGTKVDPSGVGMDVKRFYVQVDHDFDKVWKASIRSDAGYSSSTAATSLFIKTAYIQAKLSPEAILQLGSSDMPWIPFVENIYGLRYVENTLVDREKFGNSADWGVHLLGQSGMLSYNVAAVNGGGYKNPTRSKSMDLEGRVSIEPIAGLTAAVGGYAGKLGKAANGVTPTRDASRFSALLAYATKQYRVGVEYYTENNWGYTTGALSNKGTGTSFFTTVKITGPYSIFARYDIDKPSQTLLPNMKEDYFNIGLQWSVIKGLDLALVYKDSKVTNPASASTVAKTTEFGMFAQAAF